MLGFSENLTSIFFSSPIKNPIKQVTIAIRVKAPNFDEVPSYLSLSNWKYMPTKLYYSEKKKEGVKLTVKRGDIYYADLSPVIGSEQGGLRPVLIVQNDIGNKYSPTVIAAAITSRLGKAKLPTHIDVYAERFGLVKDSVILLEQIRTIDKTRLKEKMGHIDDVLMQKVNNAITISFGLDERISTVSAPKLYREGTDGIPSGVIG